MMRKMVQVFHLLLVTANGLSIHAVSRHMKTNPVMMSLPTPLDTLTSGLASMTRLSSGITVRRGDSIVKETGNLRLKLFDIEGDPECRIVRELLTETDTDCEIVPCAIGSANHQRLPEDAMPPCLMLDTGGKKNEVLVGKEAIMLYFSSTLTDKIDFDSMKDPEDPEFLLTEVSLKENMRGTSILPASIPSVLRTGRGKRVEVAAVDAPRPIKSLTLYSYEGNQFCRLVREVLCELDISYELVNAGKGSAKREKMVTDFGSSQCPYLMDPNVGENWGIFESSDIISHLYDTYANWTPQNRLLESVSEVVTPLLRPVYAFAAPLQAGNYDAAAVEKELREEIAAAPVVVFTYELSPFCSECTRVLDSLGVGYQEVSLGKEWVPLLIAEGCAAKRAELGKLTGQTSLPHVFVGGQSIGGLYSGTPGLLPALQSREFLSMVRAAEGTPEKIPGNSEPSWFEKMEKLFAF